MTLFEGLVLANLLVSLFLAYRQGKMQVDIETLYEGLALTMTKVGMTNDS